MQFVSSIHINLYSNNNMQQSAQLAYIITALTLFEFYITWLDVRNVLMLIISAQISKFTVNVDRPMFLVRVGGGVTCLIIHILDILIYMYGCIAL